MKNHTRWKDHKRWKRIFKSEIRYLSFKETRDFAREAMRLENSLEKLAKKASVARRGTNDRWASIPGTAELEGALWSLFEDVIRHCANTNCDPAQNGIDFCQTCWGYFTALELYGFLETANSQLQEAGQCTSFLSRFQQGTGKDAKAATYDGSYLGLSLQQTIEKLLKSRNEKQIVLGQTAVGKRTQEFARSTVACICGLVVAFGDQNFFIEKEMAAEYRFIDWFSSCHGVAASSNAKEVDPGLAMLDSKEALGNGGFSVVYRGSYDFGGGRRVPVAFKVLKLWGNDEKDAARRELKNLQRLLYHKNVIMCWGLCTKQTLLRVEDGSTFQTGPFILMEFADKGSLRSALEDARRAQKDEKVHELHSWLTRLQVLRDIASGMAHLHGQATPRIHNDLKASNILLKAGPSARYVAKVSDFGTMKAASTVSIMVAGGTTAYMSPQRLNSSASQTVRPEAELVRDDVWSFAMIVYEVITLGQQPWSGLSSEQILAEIMKPVLRQEEAEKEKPQRRHLGDGVYDYFEDYPRQKGKLIQHKARSASAKRSSGVLPWSEEDEKEAQLWAEEKYFLRLEKYELKMERAKEGNRPGLDEDQCVLEGCPEGLLDLMHKCWKRVPMERPSFVDVFFAAGVETSIPVLLEHLLREEEKNIWSQNRGAGGEDGKDSRGGALRIDSGKRGAVATLDQVTETFEQERDKEIALLHAASDDEIADYLEYEFQKQNTIVYEQIKYDQEKDCLGEGEIGQVFKGKFAFQEVAVKLLRIDSSVDSAAWTKTKALFKREVSQIGVDSCHLY